MYDWNNDGKIDVMDYAFYEEMIENHDSNDTDSDDDFDDLESDDYSCGSSLGKSYSGSGNEYRRTYVPTRNTSSGVPFIVRLIIVSVIASIIGCFSEVLGAIVVFIWGYIELVS